MSNLVLSSSLLEAYSLCPLKYRLYRLGDPEAGVTRRVDAARALHAAVKHCLDECYRLGGPRAYPVERLEEEFRSSFDGGACADTRQEEECRREGLRLLADYHADHLEEAAEGVRVDQALEGHLGGARLTARVDRREMRPDGSCVQILYTTSRQPPTPGAVREDLRIGLLQLVAEQVEGRPVEVELHALRHRRSIDVTQTPASLAVVEQRATALIASIERTTDFPALRGPHCRWCHAKSACPKWSRR